MVGLAEYTKKDLWTVDNTAMITANPINQWLMLASIEKTG